MGLLAATIVTGRLRLDPLIPDDADEMVSVLNDQRLHEFTGGRPLPLDQLRARYQRLAVGRSADGSQLWFNWIMRLGAGEAVGFIQATVTDHGRSAELAWVVGLRWQGRGFASEAATAVVNWLVGEGICTVQACIHPEHHGSARVAARAGLEPSNETIAGEVVWRRPIEP